MSVWDIKFESADQSFGDALVRLHRIKGEAPANKPYPRPAHSHGYYEMHLITRGSYEYEIGNKKIPVSKGQMLVISPGVIHNPVVYREDLEFVVLALSVEKQEGSAGVYKCFTEGLARASEGAVTIPGDLIRKIVGYYMFAPANSVQQYCLRKLAACEIMVGMFQVICSGDIQFYSSEKMDFEVMLETFVNDQKITLQEMSARLGYSQRQLTRIIKKRYGMTLTQFRKGGKGYEACIGLQPETREWKK